MNEADGIARESQYEYEVSWSVAFLFPENLAKKGQKLSKIVR
jgi:hypothetical protein